MSLQRRTEAVEKARQGILYLKTETYPGNDFSLDEIQRCYWTGPQLAIELGIPVWALYTYRTSLGMTRGESRAYRLHMDRKTVDLLRSFHALIMEGYSHKGAARKLKNL